MAAKELLNHLDEEDCIQDLDSDSCKATLKEAQADTGGENNILEMPTGKEPLYWIGVLWRMAYVSGTIDGTFVSNLPRLHVGISRERYQTAWQTTIESFFK